MKKQRKHLFPLILIILVVAAGLYIPGCRGGDSSGISEGEDSENSPRRSSGPGPTTYNPDDTWAVYWYLCGSDLESEIGMATLDLEEMMSVELPENVTVVIEAGGASLWHNDFMDSETLTRCTYSSDGFSIIETAPLASMGEAGTLEDFLRFCNENYPADHKVVILWDHGGGSVGGFCHDELFPEDSLSLPEIGEVLSRVGETYEIIGFDACLMATIDTADTLDEYARWMVASEETEPGVGWNYSGFLEALAGNTGMSGEELGRVICDTYYQGCPDEERSMVTLSLVNLSKTAALLEAYDRVGTEALAAAAQDTNYFSSFGRVAKSTENYGDNNQKAGYTNMVDLGDLVRKAGGDHLPGAGKDLLTALTGAVVYQVKGSNRANASGLSCYYSLDGDYDIYGEYAALQTSPAFNYYFDYALSGKVPRGLSDYLAGAGVAVPAGGSVAPEDVVLPDASELEDWPVTFNEDWTSVLTLGPDIADMLMSIGCLFYKEEEDTWLFFGFDNDVDGDWENGVFTDNFWGKWVGIDGNPLYIELTDQADDYQLNDSPVLINGREFTLIISYTYETEEYDILGARRGIDFEENYMAGKGMRRLRPGDMLEPIFYRYNEDGEEEQRFMGIITVTGDTKVEDVYLADGVYMYKYEMTDIQGNHYNSDAVFFTMEDGEIFVNDSE